jgi:hypothetical protein
MFSEEDVEDEGSLFHKLMEEVKLPSKAERQQAAMDRLVFGVAFAALMLLIAAPVVYWLATDMMQRYRWMVIGRTFDELRRECDEPCARWMMIERAIDTIRRECGEPCARWAISRGVIVYK